MMGYTTYLNWCKISAITFYGAYTLGSSSVRAVPDEELSKPLRDIPLNPGWLMPRSLCHGL